MSETCFPDCSSADFNSSSPPTTFADMVTGGHAVPGMNNFPPLKHSSTQTYTSNDPRNGSKSEQSRYKAATMTRKQWSANTRAVQILLCPSCWKKFREDESRLPHANGTQKITLDVCDQCVKNNRAQRFD